MTSASELFHISRRSRVGVGSRHVTNELEPEQRSFHHRRNHRRNDTIIDANVDCDPLRRRRHHHNHSVSAQERDRVRVEEGSGDSSLGDSSINLDSFGGVGNRGRRHIGNDRLPGAVLLARERLLERLRGVSLSANRRNNRASSRSSRNGLIVGNDYTVADSNEDHWNTETLRETLDRVLFTDSIDLTDQPSMTTSKRRPLGLTQNALTHLQLEVFTEPSSCEDGEQLMLRASQECSICLESFAKGDELVCLPCAHKFHFVCLEPWVRICGDCPYCRREIVVS